MSDQTLDPQHDGSEAQAANQPAAPVQAEATPVATAETTPAEEPSTAPAEQPVATPVEAAPVAETQSPEAIAEAKKKADEDAARREEERKVKDEERRKRDEAYAVLEGLRDAKTPFDVTIIERVKGGVRGDFQGLRVFLPASHAGIRRHVSDAELGDMIGKTVSVHVHELQSDDTGYKSAVVTRKDVLTEDYWKNIVPGSVHEGTVASVTNFGVFVDIDGVEGLVHISRLSRSRVENPADVVKKGDKLKVTVSEVDREKRKLSLSHREHEPSPWTGVETAFPVGKRVKGTVKRITDFGAYVQIAPRIEGLLRITELSWSKRIKHPSDVISVGQDIEVQVLSVSEEKQQISLGYKHTLANPWDTIESTTPIGTELQGTVQHVSTQGAVVSVSNDFDGFMPRSKMLNEGRGKKVTLEVGQQITCVVADLNSKNQSLILAMKGEDGTIAGQGDDNRYSERGERGERGERRGGGNRDDRRQPHHDIPQGPAVTLGDMLKDLDKTNLMS